MTDPLPCHLLIGPPCSFRRPIGEALREKLWDRGHEKVWLLQFEQWAYYRPETKTLSTENYLALEEIFFENFIEDLIRTTADNDPVIIDATAASRSLRLNYLQRVDWPRPVEWFGWWVQTPLETCRHNNRKSVALFSWADKLIRGIHGVINDPRALPSTEEGFRNLLKMDPAEHASVSSYGSLNYDWVSMVDQGFATIDSRRAGLAGEQEALRLHAYSRPLDFEWLMQDLIEMIWSGHLDRIKFPSLGYPIHDEERQWLRREDRQWAQTRILRRLNPPVPITVRPPRESTKRHHGSWHQFSDARVFIKLMEDLRLYLHSESVGHPPGPELQAVIDRYELPLDKPALLPKATAQTSP